MTLEIADDVIASSHLTLEEVRLALAIWLFQEKQVSLGKCAKAAGIHKMIFQKELANRKIQVHYTSEDFERDIKAVTQLP